MSAEQLVAPIIPNVFLSTDEDDFNPPPIVDRKVRTNRGLRALARDKWNCVYVPRNRILTVPLKQFEEPLHSVYKDYLRRNTFNDTFGTRHDARREWQSEQSKHIDTELFNRSFVSNNQMTGNAIAGVILQTEILADIVYADIPELSDNLKFIAETMFRTYASGVLYTDDAQERYRNLSFEEKLSVVHDISSLIGCVLWDIAWFTDPNPEPFKVWTTGNFRRSRTLPNTNNTHLN